MNDLTKLLLASTIAGTFALGGCGSESGTHDADSHAEHDDHEGHDHGEDGHEDRDHAQGERDEHEGHDHGAKRDLGSVTIAGTTLSVSMGGEVDPSAMLHFDIERTEGPEPAAIRVWIGDEAATGALRGKAIGSGGDYHADAEVPEELVPDAALWLEIETATGERDSASVQLP